MDFNNDLEYKQFLEALREAELAKPYAEMDADLVQECTEQLLELDGKIIELSPKEVARRVRAIPFVGKRKRRIKRVLAVAAVLTTLFLLANLVAYGIDANSRNIITFFQDTIHSLSAGDRVDIDQYSFYKSKNTRSYASLAAFNAAEDYAIYVPQYIIEKDLLTQVVVMGAQDVKIVALVLSDAQVDLQITIGKPVDKELAETAQRTVVCDTVTYYIFED